MLAQPTLGHFQTDQQGLMQIPTFSQPQLITHDHHHHHHHHPTMAGPLLSAGGTVVSSAPTATIVTHHPPVTTTTVVHPVPLQQQQPAVTVRHTPPPQPRRTPPQPQPQPQPAVVEKPNKAPPVNLAELLKEHGIMPESTPPSSPTSENQVVMMEAPAPQAPAPMAVTETVQVRFASSCLSLVLFWDYCYMGRAMDGSSAFLVGRQVVGSNRSRGARNLTKA